MPSYHLSPLAEQDMEAVWKYSYKNCGMKQANDYTDELVSAFEGLAASSSQVISCDNIRVGYKFCRQGKHLIYFKTTN